MHPTTVILVLAACLLCGGQASAAGVRTLGDERLEGEVRLEGDGRIAVRTADAAVRKFGLLDLAEITFKEPLPPAPPTLPPLAPEQPDNALPPPWKSVDVGQVQKPGSASYRLINAREPYGDFAFRSCGTGLEGRVDSCHFLHQHLKGDGQVLTRIYGPHNTDRKAMAGVMMRASLEPDSASVALVDTPSAGAFFIWRVRAGAEAHLKNLPNTDYGSWVKLERNGKWFAAYRSKDSISWDLAEAVEIDMPNEVFAGAAVTSAREGVFNVSHVMSLHVLPGLGDEFLPRVVLREGSVLAGRLKEAQAPDLRLECLDKTFLLSTSDVAQVRFCVLSEEIAERLKPGKTGFLTRKGQFVEGTFQSLEPGVLKVKTRTGVVSLRTGSEVAVFQFDDYSPQPVPFEVRTDRGDVLYTSRLTPGKNAVSLELAGTGGLTVPAQHLVVIHRLGNLGAAPAPPRAQGDAAWLRTREGRTFSGKLVFANGRVTLPGPGDQESRFDLKDIAEIRLGAPAQDSSDAAAVFARDWTGHDVGAIFKRGSFNYRQGTVAVLGGGGDMLKDQDSFYFVHRPVEGSAEMTVRLVSLQDTDEWAKAGLMIRESLEPGARNFLVAMTPEKGVIFQRRTSRNGNTYQAGKGEIGAPVWLRLARHGGEFVADYSSDGRKWNRLGAQSVGLAARTYFGLAVCSRNPAKLNRAVFDHLELQLRSAVEYKPQLVLRTGTQIPCAIQSLDDTLVRFVRVQKEELKVSTVNVARIQFQPVTDELTAALEAKRHGVLLQNGDFIAGEIKSLSRDSVSVRSTLFGLRAFKLVTEAVAVILSDPLPQDPPIEIRLQDGSRLCATDVSLRGERLTIHEPALGEFTLSAKELAALKRRD